jgi:hypothetical protein
MIKANLTKIFTSSIVLAFAFVGVVNAQTPPPSPSESKNNLCGGANLTFSTGPQRSCSNDSSGTSSDPESKIDSLIRNIVNIISVIVGIVAVVMIIIGGFKYITSGGDSGAISSDKNTVLYAIVWLIIVALAQVIVRFVLNKTTT